jgi:hypothetical protein
MVQELQARITELDAVLAAGVGRQVSPIRRGRAGSARSRAALGAVRSASTRWARTDVRRQRTT